MKPLGSLFAYLFHRAELPAGVGVPETVPPPFPDFGRYPPRPEGVPLVSVESLIEQQADIIKQIRQNARLITPERWTLLFDDAIRRYAEFVHLLPASEYDHHRGLGGLFRHGLEVALHSLRFGYDHSQDIGNYPSHNRQLELRWSYACFISGLCHDLGKPLSDITVTNAGGEPWSPFTESLYQWAARHRIDRYFITYRAGRHNQHHAFNVRAMRFVIRPEGDLFLSEISPHLIREVTEAIMGSQTSVATLVRYVHNADKLSCDDDKKRNPLAASDTASPAFTSITPAHKYLLDGVRTCIRKGVWTPNQAGGPLWVINRAVYLTWPLVCNDILREIPDNAGMPRDPDTLAELLSERQITRPFEAPNGMSYRYWSVLPETSKPNSFPFKAVCFPEAKLFYDVEPTSIKASFYSPGDVAKLYRKAPEGRRGVSTEQLEEVVPASAEDASPVSPPPHEPPSRVDEAAPPAEHDYDFHLSADEQYSAENLPAFEELEPGPTANRRPADSKSKPSVTGKRSNDAQNSRTWLMSKDSHLGTWLIELADHVARNPQCPESKLLAVSGKGLVIAYPEGLEGAGDEPKEVSKRLKELEWLDVNADGPPILKNNLGFKRAVLLSQEVSAKFFKVLGPVTMQPIENIDPKAQKGAREHIKVSDLQSFREQKAASKPEATAAQATEAPPPAIEIEADATENREPEMTPGAEPLHFELPDETGDLVEYVPDGIDFGPAETVEPPQASESVEVSSAPDAKGKTASKDKGRAPANPKQDGSAAGKRQGSTSIPIRPSRTAVIKGLRWIRQVNPSLFVDGPDGTYVFGYSAIKRELRNADEQLFSDLTVALASVDEIQQAKGTHPLSYCIPKPLLDGDTK